MAGAPHPPRDRPAPALPPHPPHSPAPAPRHFGLGGGASRAPPHDVSLGAGRPTSLSDPPVPAGQSCGWKRAAGSGSGAFRGGCGAPSMVPRLVVLLAALLGSRAQGKDPALHHPLRARPSGLGCPDPAPAPAAPRPSSPLKFCVPRREGHPLSGSSRAPLILGLSLTRAEMKEGKLGAGWEGVREVE